MKMQQMPVQAAKNNNHQGKLLAHRHEKRITQLRGLQQSQIAELQAKDTRYEGFKNKLNKSFS